MRRRLLALALLLLLVPVGLAHEDRDPVCGMPVEIEHAQFKTSYGGKVYYFCMDTCYNSFTADPKKYVNLVRRTRVVGSTVQVFVARPGDPTKIYFKVAKPAEDGMSPDENAALPLASAKATLFELRRDQPPIGREYAMHPILNEKNTYAFAARLSDRGEYRVIFNVRLEDGTDQRAVFDFDFEFEPHAHAYPRLPSGQEKLPMEEQHVTMKVMGRKWMDTWDALFGDAPNPERALMSVREIEAWTANLPKFNLHKYPQRKPEFDELSKDFRSRLRDFRKAFDDRDLPKLQSKFIEIDGMSCLRCHLVFRWGVAEDVSRFPDLRRMEYVWDRK